MINYLMNVKNKIRWIFSIEGVVSYFRLILSTLNLFLIKQQDHKPFINKPIAGVSFCIPTDGEDYDKTILLIRSIKKQTKKIKFEIIICGLVDKFNKTNGIKLIRDDISANKAMVCKLRNKAFSKSR